MKNAHRGHRRLPALAALGVTIPLVVAVAVSSPASAAKTEVTTTADGGPGSLRQAVADANATPSADTIVLGHDQTYVLTCAAGGQLQSTNGRLTISGNGSIIRQSCPQHRVLDHTSTKRLTLDDVTIREGSAIANGAGNGGGVQAAGAVVLVDAAVVENAAEGSGGGVYAAGSITLVRSQVDRNFVNGDIGTGGSGLWMNDANGSVILHRSTVEENLSRGSAAYGGVYSQGKVIATGSHIDRNESDFGVSGIFAFDDVWLTSSSVDGNSAGSTSGLVVTEGGSATLVNSSVDDNTVFAAGAGIQLNTGGGEAPAGRLVMIDSTANGNTAQGAAGIDLRDTTDAMLYRSSVSDNTSTGGPSLEDVVGLSAQNGDITLVESSVTLNEVARDEAGVFTQSGDIRLIRSTVAENFAGRALAGAVTQTGDVFVDNSTVSDNRARASRAGVVGIDVTLHYATVADNEAVVASALDAQALTSFGSVITAVPGIGPACVVMSTTSQGYNYEQDSDTCGFGAGPGDVINGADAQLGHLADNGGPTLTRLPADGSPLVDEIPRRSGRCHGTDQRDVRRPQNRLCDIGSVEVVQ